MAYKDSDKQKEYFRAWYSQADPKKRQENRRQYYLSHKVSSREKMRLYVLYNSYGLTPEKYYTLLGEQNGLCKICKRINEGKALCVDHIHIENYSTLSPEEKSKLVRGLLCEVCNRGLGLFRDNPELLIAAAAYIS